MGVVVSHSGLHSQIIPFWLPAGVALAAGRHFGYRILPGAGLGSLLFNLGMPTQWSFALTPELFFSALLIAVGVTLQAAAGTYLLKRLGDPVSLRGDIRLGRFILLAGFGSTLISASIGVTSLWWLTQPTGGMSLAHDWLTWWLGDSFGVILMAPLCLALLTPPHQRRSPGLHRRLVVLLAGGLTAILVTNQAYLFQLERQLANGFQRDMAVLQANLNHLYQQNLADLGRLEREFTQQQGMSPDAFRAVTSDIFADNPAVLAYSWDPIVAAEEREAFERRTQALLDWPAFAVYGESPEPDDPLVVVQYVEPFAANTAALGFNLLSEPDRRRWVIQAQETGRPVATEILNLTQAPDEPGALILQPVYLNPDAQNGGLLDRDKQLVGFMAGVFTIQRMVEAAIAMSGLEHVALTLKEADETFYRHLPESDMDSGELYRAGFAFDFAQQRWQVEMSAGHAYRATSSENSSLEFQMLLVLVGALASGVILGMYGREDSLARRVAEQTHSLRHQAHHDPLTGLPNRLRLEQEMTALLEQPEHPPFALLFMDLDRFKLINDSLGHMTGDQLLIELTRRWQAALPEESELFRLGGDEFVLLQRLTPDAVPEETAERLLDETRKAISVDGLHLQITASMGLALCPQHGIEHHTLLRNADTALHNAKSLGKNRVLRYQHSQTDATQQHFSLEQDLRLAIGTDQLLLHFQAQYTLADRTLDGVEALLRWDHPRRGMVSPGEFIPLAEETQLIVPIGWQVIEMACRQIAAWDAEALRIPYVAVNISPLQLLQSDFVDCLNRQVDAAGVSRRRLELEITETLLHLDPDFAFQQLKALRHAGYRLALDDFGTGYSSFNRLKKMPLDRIKIDRCFVKDIGRNPKDEAIICSIIDLGHRLEMSVLAEGVETWEQFHYLAAAGCDSMQGFLLARPSTSPPLERPCQEEHALPSDSRA
ncbi:EAL domain-containing protein [Halomonas campisalis]|uniref:EAL domain-containing protein n=2 Tax=Billgrantia campisalis TaxID=74661 RepID=A0ABS9PAZ4_9GAMM|nr:EAL domain-containing protein [Halomonas campisalis]